ncbi:MAG: ABC transporter ATP-binding protein [Planctomycetota bacterium]|jgi:lipoprotein-releasing system ATP-binding protein|nr:ABC transporter ATP-binding protein [Planctomycetota bacterium]
MSTTILEARHLSKRFSMGERTIRVLNDVSLQIRAGEILVISGPSGAGKSTLLHLLGLLDRPTVGDVFLNGEDVSQLSGRRQARLRNEHIGFIFQFYHLLPELNALENVFLPRMIQSGPLRWWRKKKQIREQAQEMLVRVGLGDRMTHRPSQLSGGERQRVAVARALINEPRIALCDEPTGNLDRENSQAIQELLWDLNTSFGQTFVIVTHDEALTRSGHRNLHMVDGQIVEESVQTGASEGTGGDEE